MSYETIGYYYFLCMTIESISSLAEILSLNYIDVCPRTKKAVVETLRDVRRDKQLSII